MHEPATKPNGLQANGLWRWILLIASSVFVACAILIGIDYLRPEGNMWLLGGAGVAIAISIVLISKWYDSVPKIR